MDSLPQELVDRVSSYLSRNDLKNTLLLSNKFQRAAEHYSEAFLSYELTEDNIDDFKGFCTGRLVQHLQYIKFRTSLPTFDIVDKDAFANEPCRDNTEELREMDEIFTRQIRVLFTTLHEIEQEAALDGHRGLELEIYTPIREVDLDRTCYHRMFISWRIRIISPETLPRVACIRSLLIENGRHTKLRGDPEPPFRKPDLRILIDLSTRLPNLRVLKCNIGGDDWAMGSSSEAARYTVQDWPGPRRDTRHDFAKAIQTVQLPALDHAYLDFIHPLYHIDWWDQRLPMPDLVPPAIYDPFSSSLRLLSYQLRTMRLNVVVDQTLFWPADGSTPSWPKLESLTIMFHMVSPSGTWYFKGPRDVGAEEGSEINESSYPPLSTTDDDQNADYDLSWDTFNWLDHSVQAQYRVEPNDDTLVPFLTAFARAAVLMPSLKEAALWSPLLFHPGDVQEYDDFDGKEISDSVEYELAWGIAYVKPMTQAFTTAIGEDFAAFRQMWWYVGGWRPDPELLRLFGQIGRHEHGEQLVMHWGDPYTSGLVDRGVFEDWDQARFRK